MLRHLTKMLVPQLGIAVIALVSTTAAQSAAELYKTKCIGCHGADGSGSTPAGKKLGARDLRSDKVQKQSDAELFTTMAKGKNKMPAFTKKLTDEQMLALVAYIRELVKK